LQAVKVMLSLMSCLDDHMAGTVGVALHDSLHALGWLAPACAHGTNHVYDVTPLGQQASESLGIDLHAAQSLRRRFACPCLDWSERRPHLGGALGAAILKLALKRKWVIQELDSRALNVTTAGRRELRNRFGLQL
jgi:hypothetical protein